MENKTEENIWPYILFNELDLFNGNGSMLQIRSFIYFA